MDPKLDAAALWQTLTEMAMDDALEEIRSMSDEELDACIRENGGDPAAIRALARPSRR
jgi:hypothetical protein